MYRLFNQEKKLELIYYAETRVQTTNSLTPNTHTFKHNCKKKKLKIFFYQFGEALKLNILKTSDLFNKQKKKLIEKKFYISLKINTSISNFFV